MIPAIMAALGRGGAAAGGGGGGAAGSAVSGLFKGGGKPTGAGFDKLFKTVDQGQNPIKAMTDKFNQFKGAAGRVDNALMGIPAKLGGMSKALVSHMTLGADAIKAMADPIKNLVGLSNPAAIKQFDLALNDAYATMGNLLLPVLQALTRGARGMGDTYATLGSSIAPVMDGIASAMDTVFKEIGSVARENAGAIELLSEALGFAARAGGFVAAMVLRLGSAFGVFLRPLRMVAGLLGYGGNPAEKSAVGTANRNVSIGTSAEDVGKKAMEAAFSQGLNKTESPEVQKLSGIEITLNTMKSLMAKFPTKEDVRAFINGLGSGAGGAVSAIAGGGMGPLMTLARLAASNATR